MGVVVAAAASGGEDGAVVGPSVGWSVGVVLVSPDGPSVGGSVGESVSSVGCDEGFAEVGCFVRRAVGLLEGLAEVGARERRTDGLRVNGRAEEGDSLEGAELVGRLETFVGLGLLLLR